MWSPTPKKSEERDWVLVNLCALLLICAGSFWGIAVGSWLLGSGGGILGLVAGALWGFHVAEGFVFLLKTWEDKYTETFEQDYTTLLALSDRASISSSKRRGFSRILGRKSARPSPSEPDDSIGLEDIHRRLKEINSQLWRELRIGVLASCHAGLYRVQLDEAEESLDWREVNRKTVAALHRFETATTDAERRASLNEALDRIGQKLLLVQKAALRKADKLNKAEEREIQKNEAELWRLSRLDRLSPS